MTIPLPALLAMIVLLLWPAARLFAVLMQQPVRVASRRSQVSKPWWREALVVATIVALHFLLLLTVLVGIYLIEIATRHLWVGEFTLLGLISLDSLFRFVALAQFSVFTVFAAIDARRALQADADARNSSEIGFVSGVSSLVTKVSGRLKIDLPVYLSTPVLSAAILLVGIGLLGRTIISPG
jgi:hypothetical protein